MGKVFSSEGKNGQNIRLQQFSTDFANVKIEKVYLMS